MARFTANPDAEVSVGFSAVKAGTYQMRITDVVDRNPEGKNDIQVKLEFVQPASELFGVDNLPLKGQASSIFDYISLDGSPDPKSGRSRQWKLRTLTGAVGLPWGDYDTEELRGREVTVS